MISRINFAETHETRQPIACNGRDDYQDAMTLIDLANPTRFLSLTARLLPWLAAATAVLLVDRPLSIGDGA